MYLYNQLAIFGLFLIVKINTGNCYNNHSLIKPNIKYI